MNAERKVLETILPIILPSIVAMLFPEKKETRTERAVVAYELPQPGDGEASIQRNFYPPDNEGGWELRELDYVSTGVSILGYWTKEVMCVKATIPPETGVAWDIDNTEKPAGHSEPPLSDSQFNETELPPPPGSVSDV